MDTKQEWEKIKEIFGAALERDPSERAAFLQAACGTDISLRQEVESLIEAHESSSNLWQHPLRPQPSENTEGRFIGPYQLVKKIGEGGMGQVWLAQQTAPLQRQVALKLIRWGMYDDTLLHRFQAERQSLAVMDHPSIAKVFDAGATAENQPYFVMEYVAGVPVTDYCDQKKLKVRDRLELFIKVCEGVQHAHQKAIIHRDLKPANILVAEVDGKPVPRIIDFGLAKAINREITEETLHTRMGNFVGTPGYVSPEQCDPTAQDVDTRTDVYSLGVIFYELLAGAPPIELHKMALDEFLRRLREEEPTKPSTKVRTQDPATSTAVARKRQTEPPTLVRQMRGDLDSIALKALEKDRSRRYGSPSDFAADIGRYLKNEAVLAVPPSVGYRARKFARRYRVALATACAFALVLITAAVISIRQSLRANREAAVAQAVNDFLQTDLLGQASAYNQAKPDPNITVRTVLDRAAQHMEGKFAKQPEVEAGIRATIGQTYMDLGQYPEARTQLERALEWDRRALGAEDPKTLKTMSRLGVLAWLRGKYPEAETLISQTLALQRRALGPEHPDTLYSMSMLANVYRWEGKDAQAEALHSQILEIRRRVLGPEHPDTLTSMNSLASVYRYEGKKAQAETLISQTLEIRRHVLGPEHPDTLGSMSSLAVVYDDEGKHTQAEALYSQTLEIQRRVLGPEHPYTRLTVNNLALTLTAEGRYAEAEKMQREDLDIYRRVLGQEHPTTLWTINNLAFTLTAEGRYADAEKMYRELLNIQSRVVGPEHPDTLGSMANLAVVYDDEGKYAQAEALYRKCLEASPNNVDCLNNLARLLVSVPDPGRRHPQEALNLARRAVKAAPETADYYNTLGLAEYRNGLWDEAITTFNKSAELDKGTEPAGFFFFLSMAHWKRGDKAEAARFFQQGVDTAGKRASTDSELRMFWTEAAGLLGKPGPKGVASQSPR